MDESITTGRNLFASTRGAAPYDWLQMTGGSIGLGIPLATGDWVSLARAYGVEAVAVSDMDPLVDAVKVGLLPQVRF